MSQALVTQQDTNKVVYHPVQCPNGRIRVVLVDMVDRDYKFSYYIDQATGESMNFPDMRTAKRLCSLLNALA